jgi:hypothetical protein
MSKQKKNSFIYNFGDVIKIGFRLLKDRLGGNPITDFSSSELWSSSMVCSAYCLSMLCLSIPSFLQHVSEHNISIKQISPAALVTLPGIELLFSATGDKPFTSWKKDYEKEHGKLIN